MLQKGDVLKVDFGVHVHGRIVDSAFTMTFEPTYDKLLEAVRAATDTGIRVELGRRYVYTMHSNLLIGGWYRCTRRGTCRLYPRNNGILRGRGRGKNLPWYVPLWVSGDCIQTTFSETNPGSQWTLDNSLLNTRRKKRKIDHAN